MEKTYLLVHLVIIDIMEGNKGTYQVFEQVSALECGGFVFFFSGEFSICLCNGFCVSDGQ